MEHSRFQQNSALFVLGIITLVLSIVLFVFSFYIVPFLFWDWVYDVPEFVSIWREWLKEEYNFTQMGASWLILLFFILPALLCGFVSYFASNYIDNRLLHMLPQKIESEKHEAVRRDLQETLIGIIKIFGAIVLVLVIVSMIQWLLSIPAIP
ncbi:hypothetical protein [Legionella hackeliae]|uniref:Transmembrane protein n=1 Tax=Legionella hackeliae TaxID=449 RepID=A0A0A8UPK8_LEGHA|nr:hypothetical protein [Legionella hackeliae]KTD11509.1 transmembrane protein [Legionella hackeliae]CEK10658.1 conserved membrane protein of unknown function [Legionella hackeliae]STX47404.1 transmembrane protein [Legionella hackeliae]